MWRRASLTRVCRVGLCVGESDAWRRRLVSTTSTSSAKSAYEESKAEMEADKVFEEEEFSALRRTMQDEEDLSILQRLAKKADALERELERIRWVLYARPQLLIDTHAATLRGRPTRVDAALACLSGAPLSTNAPPPDTLAARNAVLQRFALWRGTSSPLMRLYGTLRGFLHASKLQPRTAQPDDAAAPSRAAGSATDLVTLNADIDYIRHISRLHTLNYYSRINLTPARHLGMASYYVVWNVWVGVMNATGCVLFGALRGALEQRGAWGRGLVRGTVRGMWSAAQFLFYGLVVSPLVQLPRGVCNSFYGPVNAVKGLYTFDAMSGRWMRCTVADGPVVRHLWQREKRLLRTIGRLEFKRKRMKSGNKWLNVLRSLGFSVEAMQRRMAAMQGDRTGSSPYDRMPNPYETLQVSRGATTKQIKAQYKRLAVLFHPDVVGGAGGDEAERRRVQSKFEDINNAYQILSNPEKRRAYDRAGAHGLDAHDSQFGRFLSRTVEEMVQSIFGGEGFRYRLVGELLRTHWSLRFEAQVSVSMHEFEELQSIRVRQLAAELARMVDVHAKQPGAHGGTSTTGRVVSEKVKMSPIAGATAARQKRPAATSETTTVSSPFVLQPGSHADNTFSREFEERCERLVSRLTEACFGRELLDVVGEAYVVGAQRFLGLRPFYSQKWLQMRTMMLAMVGIVKRNLDLTRETKEQARMRLGEEILFAEFDVVIADLHGVLRYVVQTVLQDVAETPEVRRRRAYAVWYLGERMRAKGVVWKSSMPGDATDLMAYVQQAATSSSTTSPPPQF